MIEIIIIYSISLLMLFMAMFFTFLVMTQKKRLNKRQRHIQLARDYLFANYYYQKATVLEVPERFFIDEVIHVLDQVVFPDEVHQALIADVTKMKTYKKGVRRLHKFGSLRRKKAIIYLSIMNTDDSRNTLLERLKKEKNESVRFYLIHTLRHHFDEHIVSTIIESLVKSSRPYHLRVCQLIINRYVHIKKTLYHYIDDNRHEIRLMFLKLATVYSDQYLKDYVVRILDDIDSEFSDFSAYSPQKIMELKTLCLEALSKVHSDVLVQDKYVNHQDQAIQSIVIQAFSNRKTTDSLKILINQMDGGALDQERIATLSKMVFTSNDLFLDLLEIYKNLKDATPEKTGTAIALASRMDYLVLKLNTHPTTVTSIIEIVLSIGMTADLVDFLNKNHERALETKLFGILTSLFKRHEGISQDFQAYLKPDVLKRLKLEPIVLTPPAKEPAPKDKQKIRWMLAILIISMIIMPLFFLLRHSEVVYTMTFSRVLRLYVLEVNYYAIFYFVLLNSVYLTLISLSYFGSQKQLTLWKLKRKSLLFEKDLLPTISIIAPAYNEEKSIIESITSLLNLKYPNYEVIVVNDGSKDATLQTLVSHFELERRDLHFKTFLTTRRVRAIYYSKKIPNLIVVDKENGGKADALNVGVNLSKKDYVCGIDADTILEGEALLRLISVMLDDSVEHIALGGNIYPANGCTFQRGNIETKGLSKELVVQLQSLEYLRAFTSGRIGWSQINSLLIVSGAFGLFRRKAIIDIGGYLTISGQYKKDTVGEDMELVVRLTHHAFKAKKKFRVDYIYHANCYTELPSDFKTLLKQRNRWHRGLIDILHYHRGMFLNPKYKQVGMIGIPYFYLFELIGPFIELQSYTMIIVGLLLGILQPTIILAVFVVTIGFGIVNSLFSLYIGERENVYLNKRDTFKLVMIAIIENFGYRQIMALHRIVGFFSALKGSAKWGEQVRKGFKK